MFGLNQTKKKKAVEKIVKKEKDERWNYKAKGPDGLEAYRFEQTDKIQQGKQQARETKKNLKDIQAKGPDGLEAYRFEQTQKEANWKKTGTFIIISMLQLCFNFFQSNCFLFVDRERSN